MYVKNNQHNSFFVHSKTQYIVFNYNLSLLPESNFIFPDKNLNFTPPCLRSLFPVPNFFSCHNSKTELLSFLNMVACQMTTMCSLQSLQWGRGGMGGVEGGRGHLRLLMFLV